MSSSLRYVCCGTAAFLALSPIAWAYDNGSYSLVEANRLRAHLEYIASDELEGRDTPSRGLDLATLYVATQLKLYGVQPAGENGTYFQTLVFRTTTLDSAKSTLSVGGKVLQTGVDFIPQTGGTASGPMVYVGRGWVKSDGTVDPYKGLELKGKIVLANMGGPTGGNSPRRGSAEWIAPAAAAAARGAIGLVMIPNADYLANWDRRAQSPPRRGGSQLVGRNSSAVTLPTVVASRSTLEEIFGSQNIPSADVLAPAEGAPLPAPREFSSDMSIVINVVANVVERTAKNVIGLVKGGDPILSKEMVAFGAHIDHIGMLTEDAPDRINNGADDDGSGTVSILEIARAFATGTPAKRSTLFVWHCGEEKGLVGSNYFVENPTVKLADIVAQLNIDMIGRTREAGDALTANSVLSGKDSVYVVGSNKMSSELFSASEKVNSGLFKLTFDYKYDDPADTERIFFRSDHYNYARKGIPIIFYFTGIHADYHKVSDEIETIDFDKMEKVARTVYSTGWELANAPTRPKVDKPLGAG